MTSSSSPSIGCFVGVGCCCRYSWTTVYFNILFSVFASLITVWFHCIESFGLVSTSLLVRTQYFFSLFHLVLFSVFAIVSIDEVVSTIRLLDYVQFVVQIWWKMAICSHWNHSFCSFALNVWAIRAWIIYHGQAIKSFVLCDFSMKSLIEKQNQNHGIVSMTLSLFRCWEAKTKLNSKMILWTYNASMRATKLRLCLVYTIFELDDVGESKLSMVCRSFQMNFST